jgi:hypothetical protein
MEVLNLLQVVSCSSWGADCVTILRLNPHVRSTLDYSSVVYGSVGASYLKALDRVQSAGVRVFRGADQTDLIASLHVEVRA